MKKSILFSGLAFFISAAAAASAQNLLRDDFAPDTVRGGFVGWDFSQAKSVLLDERSPSGKPVVRITGGTEGYVLTVSSLPMRLVKGSPFRFSVKVRSSGLKGLHRREFQICNHCWRDAVEGVIPEDTKGKWVEVSREGRLFASGDGSYKCWFYFSGPIPPGGWVDIAEPRLTCQVPDDGKPVAAWDAGENRPRIVPVDPLLSRINADSARMTFYFPGAAPAGCGRRILRAELGGKTAEAELGPDGSAQVHWGRLAPGRQTLAVKLLDAARGTVLASSSYRARVRKPVLDPTPARRLNNLVSELATGRIRDGRYAFTTKEDGWVYVRLRDVGPELSARLDGVGLVPPRPGDAFEAFRYLEAGRHELTFSDIGPASSAGTFTVRLVREIVRSALNRAWKMRRNFQDYNYGFEFHDELGLLTGFNTISYSVAKWNAAFLASDFAKEITADYTRRGIRLTPVIGTGAAATKRRYSDDTWKCIAGHDVYRAGAHLEYDEAAIGYRDSVVGKWNAADAWWRAYEEGCAINVFMEDGPSGVYRSRTADLPEISAFINSGEGRGLILSEAYYRTPENEAGVGETLAFMKRQLKSMRDLVPESPRHFVYALNGWMMIGGWTTWTHPAMDICAFYSRLLQALATDPDFADIGGIGFPSPCCNEEFYRFMISALRYYGIDGGTGDFAALNGHKLYPGTIENGDFSDGLKGWTAEPAVAGGIVTGRIARLGHAWQKRQTMPDYLTTSGKAPGDDFALFIRNAKAPNRLRQTIRGLEPGRVYVLNFVTCDHELVKHALVLRDGVRPPLTDGSGFNAKLAGVEEIPELEFLRSEMGKYGKGRVFAHRKVFRAKSSEAVLEFSDWESEKVPGGRVGQSRLLNYVGVYPYFLRSEADLATLKKFMLKARGVK